MYIQVRLLNRFPQPLWYRVCESNSNSSHYKVGIIVQVPLRKQIVPAVVLKIYEDKPNVSFTIREIHSIEPFPCDQQYQSFLTMLSSYYCIKPIDIIARISHFLKQERKEQTVVFDDKSLLSTQADLQLTDEQQIVCNFLMPYIYKPSYVPALVYGVTGSGKTEIYKKLIGAALRDKKSVILLAPEVGLALQLGRFLAQYLSDSCIVHFHSAATAAQKKKAWSCLVNEQPVVVIGVHIPVLLPIANLGLIIVDEEHEQGYQEKKHPKINSKEAALIRAQSANIPILLGSATPSLNSLYNVAHKGWNFFQLKHRFSGSFPTIKTVLLTEDRQRTYFWITKELQTAIHERLHKKEQTIIFLNRRGYSFFVQCSSCSFIFYCCACSVSLTLHYHTILTCHYCGFTMQLPSICPECNAPEKKLLKKGIGTQQVVSILERLFPAAQIGRADLDISSKKRVWQQTMHDFESGAIDILVGTQTIAKGFHFPQVTLVGILWADLNLHFPLYNATETTLQQLIQVAGRAGRHHRKSEVIVQTMTYHPVFSYLNEEDYLNFYAHELLQRKEVWYPPYYRLAQIELKHKDETIVEIESKHVAILFSHINKQRRLNLIILGPAKPPVYKIKHVQTRKLYIKGLRFSDIISAYTYVQKTVPLKSSLFFTPNPQT